MKESQKTILCYGDSNTWGNVPGTDERYPRNIRWPAVLQTLLGDRYEISSEGLCGRVLKSDKVKPDLNGITYILPCVRSHEPLDVVIIMLGTNDVNDRYEISVEEIAQNLKETISIIQNADIGNKENPKIVVVCPPQIAMSQNGWHETFIHGAEKMKRLPELYKKIATEMGCIFLSAGDHIVSSQVDGIHFDKEEHVKLAEVLVNLIKENS